MKRRSNPGLDTGAFSRRRPRPDCGVEGVTNNRPMMVQGKEMLGIESHDLKELRLGKEYFFPARGSKESLFLEDDYENGDHENWSRDQFFSSKIYYSPKFLEFAQYPDEIRNNIINIDSNNFDVVSFLSTVERDYLIRNHSSAHDDYNQVKVKSLSDKKWVMICCFFCPIRSGVELQAVSNACSDLYDCYGDSFEMVLVFKMKEYCQDDESAFRHTLSGFPSSCLVVPFWDSHSRDSICCSLDFARSGKGIFLRPDERKVIWHKDLSFFRKYGLDTFPFSDEILQIVGRNAYRDVWKCLTLEQLFCCSSLTVLRKTMGGSDCFEKTTIEELQEKLVGVYVCFNGDLIPMLHKIYKDCKYINKTFEIVLVYYPSSSINSDPQLFQKVINQALEKRNISWWVLPFKSWVSLSIGRLCKVVTEDRLIVVGKGFADTYGAYVVKQFGMDAYPFSRDLMFQKEADRIREVSLTSLLVHEGRDYIFRNHFGDLEKIFAASLTGKNIFIYVAEKDARLDSWPCEALLEHYWDLKAKDPEFEMVYIGPPATSVYSHEMPWLICPYDSRHVDLVCKEIFAQGEFYDTLVAFKKDGLIGSIKAHKHLSSRGVEAFPFDGSRLKEEVIDEFDSRYVGLPLGDM